MNYKLVAVDMDGTLLNSDGNISEQTVEAIRKCVEKGIIVTISTGRPIQGINRYNEILKLDVPFITYNGAMIVKSMSKEILYEQGLSAQDARQILKLGQAIDTTVIVWSNNKLYVNKLNDQANDYKKLSALEPILITDQEALIKNGITKILWSDDVDKIKAYQEEIAGKVGPGVTYCTSKPIYLEFFDVKVSKALSLEKVCRYYSIKSEETIAIGDGYNDLSMLEYAGLGIAMGNAPDDIKAKCGYVTETNNKDGVASALNKFLL